MLDSFTAIEGIKMLLHDSTIYYMVSIGLDSKFTYLNQHYTNSFRHVDDDFVGKPYHISMHPDDMHICIEVGGKCFAEPDKSFPATIRKYDGKGGYVVTQWDYRLIVRNGQPEGVFCLGHDITNFAVLKDDFGLLVNDMANKERIMFQVAYNQSHIVRAPIANIIGLVSILKNMELDHNLTSIVSMLDESSGRLDDVIRSTVKLVSE